MTLKVFGLAIKNAKGFSNFSINTCRAEWYLNVCI